MNLATFTSELTRIFNNPGALTRRQGAEFVAELHNFLQQSRAVRLWSSRDSDEMTSPVGEACPHSQCMKRFEQVLSLGLDQMCLSLMSSYDRVSQDYSIWQMLTEHLIQPMSRLSTFSQVMQACMSPMRSWLDVSVLIGHRALCLADQIRQYCLERYLKKVAPSVSIAIFRAAHCSESKWSCGDLQLVQQYIGILHQYQRFQSYLDTYGYHSGPYDSWEGDSGEAGTGSELFNLRRVFVEPYLDCLRQFYQPLLHNFDANLVAPSVSEWLMTEQILAAECDIAGFRDAVVSCLLQEAVKDHLAAFGEAARQALELQDSQGLGLFCRTMVMVEPGLDHLLEVVRCYVRDQMLRMFGAISLEFESLDPNSAKATSMYIDGCVAEMRAYRALISATELSQPLNQNLLLGTVKTGIADVLNSNPLVDSVRRPAMSSYPAAALAHHFHRQMRGVRTLDLDSREAITDLMTLYSLLLDKESFLLRYHSLLRERLLSDACDNLSLEAENYALESFTKLSGWKAVYEVKSVLKDFAESEDFNASLRNLEEYQRVQRQLFGSGQVPVKFTLVRGYFWRMAAERVDLPPQLATLVDAAVAAYQSSHVGRLVSFTYSYGSGLLAFSPLPGQSQEFGGVSGSSSVSNSSSSGSSSSSEILLRCSTAILILLLNFNESDSWTEAALLDRTGIRPGDMAFYLLHLVKAGVLLGASDGGGAYTVNQEFRCNAKLVNLMVSQQQQAQRHRRRLERQDERMKEKRLQCAIVSVMKQSRSLTRRDLIELVKLRLPHSPLHAEYFTEQLTYLISGGYIKLAYEDADDNDDSVVEYIP